MGTRWRPVSSAEFWTRSEALQGGSSVFEFVSKTATELVSDPGGLWVANAEEGELVALRSAGVRDLTLRPPPTHQPFQGDGTTAAQQSSAVPGRKWSLQLFVIRPQTLSA